MEFISEIKEFDMRKKTVILKKFIFYILFFNLKFIL